MKPVDSFLYWLYACGYFKPKYLKGKYDVNWPWMMCN